MLCFYYCNSHDIDFHCVETDYENKDSDTGIKYDGKAHKRTGGT